MGEQRGQGAKGTELRDGRLTGRHHFGIHRNMEIQSPTTTSPDAIAATFAALGQPSRLRIVRLLLSAHPHGLPAGEIQKTLGISASTLSHHLDKLRQVGVVAAEKDRQWIWYRVQADSLKALMDFLFAECCTRNQVIAATALDPGEQPDCCR